MVKDKTKEIKIRGKCRLENLKMIKVTQSLKDKMKNDTFSIKTDKVKK